MEEVLHDPLFQERQMVHSYSDMSGEQRQGFGIPVKMSRTPGSIRTIPGPFGEGTVDVLREAGYKDEEIEAFIAAGVVSHR
jgi:formyl-CoA transferase/CoA:oxalate CoA-transferase